MSKLRRFITSDRYYFITVVTYKRNPILIENVNILRESFKRAKSKHGCDYTAMVILPDHFHLIVNPGEKNISDIMYTIKMSFSKQFRFNYKHKGKVWQLRFWDHIIRNDKDFNSHIDYIHYNPVKHGLVDSPFDWEYTSLHKFYKRGYYSLDWGKKKLKIEGDFGE